MHATSPPLPRLAPALLAGALALGCAARPRVVEALPDEPLALEDLYDVGPAAVGQAAPPFALADLDGNLVRLDDLAGDVVVLEWFNPECPFTRHAHEKGVLRALPAELADEGVVWLAVNSAAPGKLGADVDENRAFAESYGLDFPILLDGTGAVGHAYGAARSPQLFLIDRAGTLAWSGPPDDAPFGKVKGGGSPRCYVLEAVAAALEGFPPALEPIEPYGCAIQYAPRAQRAAPRAQRAR